MERKDASYLGRFIKECRESLGYTSRRVEEITKSRPGLSAISHSNLLAIEKGVHVPTYDKILTLSYVFNVPTRHFEDRLKRDMLAVPAPPHDATCQSLIESAQAAAAAGETERALQTYLQAYAVGLAEQAREPGAEAAARLAETRLQAANCRSRLGLLRIAKDDLEELIGAEDVPAQVMVRTSFLLAETCRELKNQRLAMLHAKAALDLLPGPFPPAQAAALRAKLLNTMGNILDETGDGVGAIDCYHQAYALFEAAADHRACGLIARNLGETHLRRHDFEAAARFLEAGLLVARETGDRRGTAYGLVNLARTSFVQNRHAEARERAKEAKEIAQSENYPDILFASVYYLWRVSTTQGEPSLSRVYEDRLAALHRKLETRCVESEEWAQHVVASRRMQA